MSDHQAETDQAQDDIIKGVFINCPFDPEFEPLFQAIVFSVVSCDFTPHSALETGTVSEPRMDRITRAIFSSKYSIHDLSRCKGEGNEQLARFNMPLELGIAMARRYETRNTKDQHDWLLLVPEGHVYLKVISDLAGFDPMNYDCSVETIIQRVISWLATRPDATPPPTPKLVLDSLPAFVQEFDHLKEDWGDGPPWPYVVEAARKTAPRH